MVDYIIHYMKANGKTNEKVFKLAIVDLHGTKKINKRHSLRQMSTRKHYSGKHSVEILVNGERFCHKSFELF